MNLMLILQVAPEVVSEVAEQSSMNLWTMAKYGGPIMIVLALMLAFAVYLFIERLVTLKQASKENSTFMNRIKDYIYDGKIESAINLCREVNTPSARMIEKGISRLGRPLNDVLVAIENVGNLEVANLEKGLVIMASISGGAPMLGFLGTVTGMVQTFYNMSMNNSGMIQLSDLSSGMYQAMVTTIGGLIVGILAYFAYNYLVSRVNSVVNNLESKTMEFMDILNEPAK
ncbi:MotA/TolQ/ExbB proton channel family protein [Paludibacter sp. 221]|uniref:MotA/TolQ/ExbB proton channel family protein n=1 Tax=Paludibacter sp. 221 TaxID=2302939 RepID=UPI0013D068D3|nr:MotA/TolQ/ExbB proton channel family protein [Paludibacter sp. 221]NDV47468.1 MotA/TolQ/ExbB proton channel family protein [Paludibacter sp. 221]